MGIGVYIEDEETGGQAHVQDSFSQELRPQNGGKALTVINPQAVFGQFIAANRTSAGTTIVLAPVIAGSLVVTDLIISADKVNSGSVILQFTDGTETVVLYKGITTDAPINGTSIRKLSSGLRIMLIIMRPSLLVLIAMPSNLM